MKKTIPIYLLFILSLCAFVGLRIYSSKPVSEVSSKIPAAPITTPVPVEITPEFADIEGEDFFPDSELLQPEDTDSKGLLNDPWHGDFTQIVPFSGTLPRIICFGDSLTQSTDEKTAYPDYLREISGCEVINYGVTSENTSMIAMREGGIPVILNSTVIPDESEFIPIFFHAENGDPIYFLENGDAGINPCTIKDIEGKITKINGAYYFKRLAKGKQTVVDDGEIFKTFAMNDKLEDDILVIYTGTNDLPTKSTIYDTVDDINAMIEYYGTSKYLIIGLTYDEKIKDIFEINSILANEYEDNFIDIRTYMINYGIEDAGLTPTTADSDMMSKKRMPPSLMRDSIHGNKFYNELLAKQIYRRLQYLGYLPLEENNTDSQ